MPSSGSAGTACCTAWPVPSCGIWRTNARSAPAKAASTASAPWPVTTMQRAGASASRGVHTWPSSGLPPSACSTLGRAERIRVPLPAAMITTLSAIREFRFV